MTTAAADTDVFRLAFERVAAASGDPEWLGKRRAEAVGRFVDRGFPGPRDEPWRHTPIGPLTRIRWEPADPSASASGEALAGLAPGTLGGAHAVLVGGRVSPEFSRLDTRQPGIEVRSLADVLRSQPERVRPYLGLLRGEHTSVFADLNTAFAADGVVVFLEPGAVLEEPVHIIHLAVADSRFPVVSSPRILVLAGRSSKSRIVETYVGPAEAVHLTNAVAEVWVDDNAFVDHYTLQREGPRAFHVATRAARLGRDSRFADHSFSLGAAISRTDIDVRFDGEGGECSLDGLFMVDGERLSDTHTRVDHARPHCTSRELYKGVLDGRGRGVFHGLVVVRPGAQKTDAYQMNRNLLLSREALVHSTPQLEILADDVKCRHGSTTGQLDPAALFYLRSRGIGEVEARSLLTWAFASDLVRGLRVEPLREALASHIREHLPGAEVVREVVA